MKIFQRRSQSESPANASGPKKIDDRLQEVFVYDEGELPNAASVQKRPQLAASKTQPNAAQALEVSPNGNYVQNLRKNGGDRTYSPNSSAPNSQGSSAMAGDNSKFITVPYSLMPAQGTGQPQESAADNIPNRQQIEEAVMTAVQQHVRTDAMNQEGLKQLRAQVQTVALDIRSAKDREAVMKAAVFKTLEALGADRVTFYRCTSPEQGLVEAEAVVQGWTPALGEYLPLVFLGSGDIEDYQKNQVLAFSRDQEIELSPYQHQLMDKYQVKASLSLPVVLNEKPWGFLVVHQCKQERQWHDFEIDLLYQIVTEIRLKLQALEFEFEFQQQVDHGAALVKVIEQIQRAEGVEGIFRTATSAIRKALNCDRAVIYQCNEDWSGKVVAEAVGKGWVSILKEQERDQAFCSYILPDNCSFVNLYPDDEQVITFEKDNALFRATNGGQFNHGVPYRKVDDVYAMGFSDCYIETLEKFQCRAYIHAPIFQDGKFWGILCAYQNSGPRKWTMGEASLMVNLATPLNTALQMSRTVQQVKDQTNELFEAAKREQLASSIIDRIRGSFDTDQVFKVTTKEIRRFMNCDRAVIYKFHQDWSGTFVAESVGSRLNSILGKGFSADMGNCHSLTSLRPEGMPLDSRDVKIAEISIKEGRDYNRSGFFLDDIEAHDLPGDFMEAMDGIGARAYMMTGIFVGDKLWGMLAVYHGEIRAWQEGDRKLIAQIATQCGVALQQAEFVTEIQQKSAELSSVVSREKAAKEEFQREVVELLRAVAPALRGDLTVRAPVTEDEVGTVADAYNNTIHALRSIVVQVKEAATQVSSTSKTSGEAIAHLSNKAQKEVHVVQKALTEIQSMQGATEEVVTTAQGVEAAVQQANQVVKRGDNAMDRTVDGIMAIRSTVSETSKKIKRLSESSQKISRVVSLIGDFTTQTQLLALNAAIEATRAGEYGRGFAVVADEVRSLARQSAEATTEIEKLVQEIQAETSAVTQAMDTGIDQVVSGTNLVNETRDSLTEIVEATAQISSFVEGITLSANSQSKQFKSVAETMNGVTELASETSKESLDISDSFKELLTTAEDLQATVGKFKV